MGWHASLCCVKYTDSMCCGCECDRFMAGTAPRSSLSSPSSSLADVRLLPPPPPPPRRCLSSCCCCSLPSDGTLTSDDDDDDDASPPFLLRSECRRSFRSLSFS